MNNNKLAVFISTVALFMIIISGFAKDTASKEVTIRQYLVDFWSRGNLEVAEELLDSKVTLISPDGVFEGIAAIKSLCNTYISAFSDLSYTIDNISVSDNEIEVKWLLKGTHDGKILGVAPTWQEIELQGTSVYVIEGGKIVKEIKDYNEQDFLEQLGVVLETSSFERASAENTQTMGAMRYGR